MNAKIKNKYDIYLENHSEIEEQVGFTGRAEKTILEIEVDLPFPPAHAHNIWWGFRRPSFDKGLDCDWEEVTDNKIHGDKLPPSLQDNRIIFWTPKKLGQILPTSCH